MTSAAAPDLLTPQAALRARALSFAGYHPADYVALHPDLASVAPDDHFLDYGLWEQRQAVVPERFAARLAQARLSAFPTRPLQGGDLQHRYRSVFGLKTNVHAPLPLSTATAELVSCVLSALKRLGLAPELYLTQPLEGTGAIVIDPAALFGPVSKQTADLELYRSCVFVTGKAPGDGGFAAELPFLLAAGAVVAFDADTFALLAATGAPSAWLSPSRCDSVREPPPASRVVGLGRAVNGFDAAAPWGERPVDVAAIQTLTPARHQTWARIVEPMTGFKTVLRPHDGEDGPARASRRYVFERSKLALHLEGDGLDPPPWRWLDDVAASGAALVSEPLAPHPFLRSGVNYFEADAERLPSLISHLLHTVEGRASAEAAAASLRQALERRADPELNGLELVGLLDSIQVQYR